MQIDLGRGCGTRGASKPAKTTLVKGWKNLKSADMGKYTSRRELLKFSKRYIYINFVTSEVVVRVSQPLPHPQRNTV